MEQNNQNIDNDNENELFEINIFRYKFDEDFTSELYKFSKIHQYDHRKDFKEAWNIWIEENEELVDDCSSQSSKSLISSNLICSAYSSSKVRIML